MAWGMHSTGTKEQCWRRDSLATLLRHEDWDIVPVANPGAPPAPPTGPPQEDAAGVNAAAGTNASSSGTPSGGDQSSVMGSSGGVPIVKTQGMVS